MPSLYVDRRGVEIEVDGGALIFKENGTRIGTVPIAPLDRIFIRGNVGLKANVLSKLGESGIGVVILSSSRSAPTLLMPKPHSDASRRIAQYCAFRSSEAQLMFSKEIVLRKLSGQKRFLEELRDSEARHKDVLAARIGEIEQVLAQIGAAADKSSLLGLEGRAGASYFAAFRTILPASLKFTGRNRRPPRDPFNVVLSLGYTLLHCEGVRALYAVGLDPYVGFFHSLDYGREALACDFVESFRTEVDRFAFKAFRERTLRPEDFSISPGGCHLGKAGRERFYPAWEASAEKLRKTLENAASKWCGTVLEFAGAERKRFA